jgi:multidrug resistance protein, MATE family
LFATFSYWLVGFTSAWALGFRTSLGAAGVWVGLSIGTVVFAVLLIVRFRLLANRLVLQ